MTLIVLLLYSNSAGAIGLDYKSNPIKIAGCPSNLSISIPTSFRKPSSESENILHRIFLKELHSIKNQKTIYSNIFLTDWNTPEAFPQIAVGSLGSLLKFQGNITSKDWTAIKNTLTAMSPAESTKIAASQSKVWIDEKPEIRLENIQMNKPFEIDSNSIASIGVVSAELRGRPTELYVSMKSIYVNKCIVYINISIPTENKYSKEYLFSLLNNVTVNSSMKTTCLII